MPLLRSSDTIRAFDIGKNDVIELFNKLSGIILSDSDLLEMLIGQDFIPYNFEGFDAAVQVFDNVSKMTSGIFTAPEQTRFNKIAKVLMLIFGDKLFEICIDDTNINPDVLFLCQAVQATANGDLAPNDILYSNKLIRSGRRHTDIMEIIKPQKITMAAEIEKARKKAREKSEVRNKQREDLKSHSKKTDVKPDLCTDQQKFNST